MVFNGNQRKGLEKGAERSFYITGTKGTIRCRFDNTEDVELVLSVDGQEYRPALEGWWHRNGFAGTMGELLCAIEEQRIPWNNAADNLESLKLCYSACASADRNMAIEPNVTVLSRLA
jgi:predicted dehydrogenase